MNYIVVDPAEYLLNKGESWYVVSPNNAECDFTIPEGAFCCCTKNIKEFYEGTLYYVTDQDKGWVTVVSVSQIVKMPEYLFARHFDAESFVHNRNTSKEYYISTYPTNQIIIED
jgi:hypothetical protein